MTKANSGRLSLPESPPLEGWIRWVASLVTITVGTTILVPLVMRFPAGDDRHAENAVVLVLATIVIMLGIVAGSQALTFSKIAAKEKALAADLKALAIEQYNYLDFLHSKAGLNPRDRDEKFRHYLNGMMTIAARLFSTYTGDKCAACIKLFSSSALVEAAARSQGDGNPPYVFTFRRDRDSWETRRYRKDQTGVRTGYKYEDNFGFYRICTDQDAPDYFVCNDLSSMPEWRCASTDWREYYNATAVAAVKPPDYRARDHCLALVCVDNKKGRFDEDRAVHLLEAIAVDLYYALRATNDLREANYGK